MRFWNLFRGLSDYYHEHNLQATGSRDAAIQARRRMRNSDPPSTLEALDPEAEPDGSER